MEGEHPAEKRVDRSREEKISSDIESQGKQPKIGGPREERPESQDDGETRQRTCCVDNQRQMPDGDGCFEQGNNAASIQPIGANEPVG